MRETDDIERLFRESFEGFEVTPPASVKAAIDKATKRKPGLIWWLSALFLVLTATAGYFIINTSAQKNTTTEIVSSQETDYSHENDSSRNKSLNSINTQTHSNAQSKNQTGKTEHSKERSDQQNGKTKTISRPTNQSNDKNQVKSKTADLKQNGVVKNTSKSGSTPAANKTKSAANPKTANKQSNNPFIPRGGKANPTAKKTPLPDKDPVLDTDSKSPNSEDPTSLPQQTEAKSSTNLTALNPQKKPIPSLAPKTITDESEPEKLPSKDDKNNNDGENWTLSYYAGPQFDIWKTPTQDEELTLKPSFRTSLEINRNLPYNFSVSAGAGFNKFQEKYSLNYIQSIDSVYMGFDSIPIYDQQDPDSIIGYTYIDLFEMDTVKGNRNNTFNTTAISIPVHLRRTFEITDNWVLMTDLGANFNFYKTKKDSSSDPLSPEPATNSFGLNASMRLHAGYKMDNWMFTAGVNGSIYLKTPVTYDGLTTKRYYISPQIGIHYFF